MSELKLFTKDGLSRFWTNFKTYLANTFVPKTRKVNLQPLSNDITLYGTNIDMDYENQEYTWTQPAPSIASDINYQLTKHLKLEGGQANAMTGNLTQQKTSLVTMNVASPVIRAVDKNKEDIARISYDPANVWFRTYNPTAGATDYTELKDSATGYIADGAICSNDKFSSSTNTKGWCFDTIGECGGSNTKIMFANSGFTKTLTEENTASRTYDLPDQDGELLCINNTNILSECSADTGGLFTISSMNKVGPFVEIQIVYQDAGGTLKSAASSAMIPAQYRPDTPIGCAICGANSTISLAVSGYITTGGKIGIRTSAATTTKITMTAIYYCGY